MPFVNWLKRHLVVIAGLVTLGYLLLPNVVVTVFSFNKPKGRFNYQWQQFSTDAWKDPCGVADMCGSLSISLQIAFWATIGATVLGTMIAFALVRYRFRARGAVNSLIFLPMAMPEVVMAASLLTLFLNLGAQPGLLDDPDRPHHVLPQLRRHRRQGARDVDGPAPGGGRPGPLRRSRPDLPAGHPAHRGARNRGGCAARPSRSPSTISSSPISTRARPSPSPCSSGARHSAELPFRSTSSVRPCSSSPSCSSCSSMVVGNRRNRQKA